MPKPKLYTAALILHDSTEVTIEALEEPGVHVSLVFKRDDQQVDFALRAANGDADLFIGHLEKALRCARERAGLPQHGRLITEDEARQMFPVSSAFPAKATPRREPTNAEIERAEYMAERLIARSACRWPKRIKLARGVQAGYDSAGDDMPGAVDVVSFLAGQIVWYHEHHDEMTDNRSHAARSIDNMTRTLRSAGA